MLSLNIHQKYEKGSEKSDSLIFKVGQASEDGN